MKEKMLFVFIIIMILDLLIPFLIAPFYKDYSHQKMVMSALASPTSPVKFIYSSWLFIGGIGFTICTFFFATEYSNSNPILSKMLLVLLLLFSIGAMILSGIFPVDEGKEMVSLSAKVHGIGSSIGFMALLFVPLILSIINKDQLDSQTQIICLICFILALCFFILFVMSDKPEFSGSIISKEGIWQRLTLLFMYLPIMYTCVLKIIESASL